MPEIGDDDPTPPRGLPQVPPRFAQWRRPRLAIPPPPPPNSQLTLACNRIAALEARMVTIERMQTLLITVLTVVAAEKIRLLSWLAELMR